MHKAHCKCGYEATVTVGGGMYDFHKVSYFPHYCENCGLVEVNIAKSEAKGIVPPCPKCGNNDLYEYGKPPVSGPVEGSELALEWDDYQATESGNLCPVCKRMTMVIDRSATILFD